MEQDDRLGMVEEYLNTLLPENWDRMELYERRNYLSDRKDPTLQKGTVRRMQVSNAEIWVECFGRNMSDMKPADSYAISALMVQLRDWEKSTIRVRLPIVGMQRVYIRRRKRVTTSLDAKSNENAENVDFLG